LKPGARHPVSTTNNGQKRSKANTSISPKNARAEPGVLQKRDESTRFNTGEWESPNRQVAASGFAESISFA
jgi:hypothetical protein